MTRRDYSACERFFIRESRRKRLNPGVVEQITMWLRHPERSLAGEVIVEWREVVARQPLAFLEVSGDSFAAFSSLSGLISSFAEFDGKTVQPDEFCELLKQYGFKEEGGPTHGQ